MSKKFFIVVLMIIGVVSVILSMHVFNLSTGSYVLQEAYGGDAYTGIQNAAAQTANNVQWLTEAVSKGVGSILLVGGLTLISLSCIMLCGSSETRSLITGTAYSKISVETPKVNAEIKEFRCPKCGKKVLQGDLCCSCGQAFDWSKV